MHPSFYKSLSFHYNYKILYYKSMYLVKIIHSIIPRQLFTPDDGTRASYVKHVAEIFQTCLLEGNNLGSNKDSNMDSIKRSFSVLCIKISFVYFFIYTTSFHSNIFRQTSCIESNPAWSYQTKRTRGKLYNFQISSFK